MKKTTKFLPTLALSGLIALSSLSGFAYAKGYGDRDCSKGQRQPNFERLANKLSLSEEQSTNFIEVMEAQQEKRTAIFETMRAEHKEKMDAHKAETIEALSSVLDSSQLETLESIMERQGKKHKHHK